MFAQSVQVRGASWKACRREEVDSVRLTLHAELPRQCRATKSRGAARAATKDQRPRKLPARDVTPTFLWVSRAASAAVRSRARPVPAWSWVAYCARASQLPLSNTRQMRSPCNEPGYVLVRFVSLAPTEYILAPARRSLGWFKLHCGRIRSRPRYCRRIFTILIISAACVRR